jgi:hypothetical protein
MVHHKHYPLIVGIPLAIVAILTLITQRQKHQMDAEIHELDKNIKELQLAAHVHNAQA